MTRNLFSSESASFLYAITDPGLSHLSHFDLVKVLAEHGVRWIQIREKRTGRMSFDEAVRSIEFARQRGARIIVNDRVDLALASDADGVHLGEDDLPPEEARKILGKEKIIGLSTHSVAEAVSAAMKDVDYIAIGPVFQTSTKKLQYEPLGLGAISEARKQIVKPIIAIGGIKLRNVADVIGSGADAVAVISDLLCEGEIGKRVDEYMFIARSLKRCI